MEELHCLLEMPGLRVSYDPVNTWLYNQWLGEHTEASVKVCAEAVCACLRAQPCAKILSDHSQLRGDWQAAAAWVGQENFAHLAAQGIAYFAWVYSPSYTDRVAMERTLLYTKAPLVAIFDDLAEAYDWLQRCPARSA